MLHTRTSNLFLMVLIHIAFLALISTLCKGNKISESEPFRDFLSAIDPENMLEIDRNKTVSHPCLNYKLKGVIQCNLQGTTIVEIWLENLNLTGKLDADSLCRLRNLRVVSLAENKIQGNIPNSILHCTSLTHLNLSNNLLNGRVPLALTKLKHLRSLNITNNCFHSNYSNCVFYSRSTIVRRNFDIRTGVKAGDPIQTPISVSPQGSNSDGEKKQWYTKWKIVILLFIGVCALLLFTYFIGKRAAVAYEKEILKSLPKYPFRESLEVLVEPAKQENAKSQLVFFVKEEEKFELDDLLEATADLRNQNMCSSLFKVVLKNNVYYAVKRLKKVQVSFEEFERTMRQIGNMKHPNILPLVGYVSAVDEKLLIYKYQSNGSLLDLLESKNDFPWRHRLSVAAGIARGLELIHKKTNDKQSIIPHGNLKLSNILLTENGEPLISEYGISSTLIDPKGTSNCPFGTPGYTVPEKKLTEKADVFSYGVILLELLAGKTVERSGIEDLPKWVKAMVREEWTGEVLDKEVGKSAKQWAFSLLNTALKCVSDCPDDRPTSADVVGKIEEVINAQNDHSFSYFS